MATVFKLNINDTLKWNQGLQLINNNSSCNIKLSIDDLMDKYYPYLKAVDSKEKILFRTLFDEYGGDLSDQSPEYAYVLAFILGCKDYIGSHKCVYNTVTDIGEIGKEQTWYQVMRNIVKDVNKTEKNLKVIASPDPYPDFMSYPDENVKEGCGKVIPKPKPKPKPVCPVCPVCPKSPVCPVCKQNFKSSEEKPSEYNKLFFVSSIVALLFIIFSNNMLYEASNYLTSVTMYNNCPTNIGNVIHASILFCVFFVIYRYIVKSD